MASVATSNISYVNYNFSKLSISGFPIENARIASGQSAGDTAVIVPQREKLIKSLLPGPYTHDLPASGASSVTITIVAGTATIGQFDVWIVCQPR